MKGASRIDGALPTGDGAIEAMVRQGALVPLLAALAQATGDLSLLRDDLRPDPAHVREPQGGLSPDQRGAARVLIAETLVRLAHDDHEPVAHTDTDALRRIMEFTIGEEVSPAYLDLLIEELAVSGEDLRSPDWRKDDIDADRPFRVVIVGAGMSGLLAAHRLQQAGIDYVVVEKNDDVGGTWLENRYPGCRVDVPNHLYSYSFAQRDDWPQHFSPQAVLLDYFRTCADDLGIRPHIRFGTEVVSATYREVTGDWEVALRSTDGGPVDTIGANVVVSAVGQLNRPSLPAIAGRDDFAGPVMHSAEWDPTLDLDGKRVAVIGTGASGIQLIPEIADAAAAVHVFQRTPNWFLPAPEYHAAMPEGAQWLLRNVANYSQWYRFWLFWRLAEGALPAAKVDPDWSSDNGSISARNDELRALLTMYIESQFADTPDLLAQVVPRYPPLAKRMLLDNGTWASTLKRDDVHLVSGRIDRIEPHAITTVDGERIDVDVIIFATGFEASRFLMPMEVSGRGGADLHASWDGDARAYLGMTVPGFPNLFCLYGPNTNLVANGSIIFFSECEVRYVLESIKLLLTEHRRALECRREVFDAYNVAIDEGNRQMAWGASAVNSWYKNRDGRVTQNWPFALLEFWERTRRPDPADFELS